MPVVAAAHVAALPKTAIHLLKLGPVALDSLVKSADHLFRLAEVVGRHL